MPAPSDTIAWHSLSAEKICGELRADPARGLSVAEAATRLRQHGPNALPEAAATPWWRVALHQFQSPLIYILLAAVILAFALGKRTDAAVILVVVVINAIIGAMQENRAERSMAALRRLAAASVRVRREGRDVLVEARELVPGDILLLAAGDAVAADARLTEASHLEAAESALTGESLPVAKSPATLQEDTLLADRRNMLFSGTHLTAGRGRAIIVATGAATEVGRIARMTAAAVEPQTPLEQRIAQFGRWLVAAAFLLVVVVTGIGLLRGLPAADIFMVAVSQMVSMVPEGLPVAMTIALAVGMQRMAARGAIVRRLAAVETLGSTTIICTDKTGTLTRNEMTATALWLPGGRAFEVTGTGYMPSGKLLENGRPATPDNDPQLRATLDCATLCNDARLVQPDASDTRWRAIGDPTEAALLTLALKAGLDPHRLRHEQLRIGEMPFDADAKMMATIHQASGGGRRVCLKGAPEAVLALCGHIRQDGQSTPLDESARAGILAAGEALAARALRVLAIAEAEGSDFDDRAGFSQFSGKATFLGLIGQMDPPREEVRDAVGECARAGIRPVMVTGDHRATGLAIAHELGIARPGDHAVDGRELERMSEPELRAGLDRIAVFARVHPAQKLRIVEAFQARGEVVAMTGDGVNDAPALAQADVGVAMGLTGTETAKSAAKIIISDDNFITIVRAVEGGRLVFRNLQKVVLYLFATSLAEILVLLAALFLGYPLPLAAVQILWINLVTEGTVAVNLVMEPPEGDEMLRPPIARDSFLLGVPELRRMALMTTAIALCTFGFFAWRLQSGAPFALVQTETFTVLAVCQWFNVLNCESPTLSALRLGILKNGWLLGGLAVGNVLHFAVIYAPPLNRLFHTTPIPFADFFLIGAVASIVLWAEETRKFFARRREQDN